jgi:hypothetical protein
VHLPPVRALLCVACVAVAMAFSPRADAESPTSVAVVGPPGDRLTARLRAELRELGLSVTAVDEDGTEVSPPDLQTLARASGAAVTIRASPSASGGVELWMFDRVTGKILLREVLERDLSEVDSDAVVALRAVELLRASLLELELEHPGRGDVEPTPELRRAAGLERKRPAVPPSAIDRSAQAAVAVRERREGESAHRDSLALEVALALNTHVGQTRVAPGIALELFWQPSRYAAVGAWGVLPVTAESVARDEGVADVKSSVLGVGLRFPLASTRSRWAPALGAGAAALFLRAEGSPEGVLQPKSTRVLTVGPTAEASLGFRLHDALSLGTAVHGLVAFPRPVVMFGGQTVATLGRPFVVWTIGLQYRALFTPNRD